MTTEMEKQRKIVPSTSQSSAAMERIHGEFAPRDLSVEYDAHITNGFFSNLLHIIGRNASKSQKGFFAMKNVQSASHSDEGTRDNHNSLLETRAFHGTSNRINRALIESLWFSMGYCNRPEGDLAVSK